MQVRVLRRRWAQVLRLAELNNDRILARAIDQAEYGRRVVLHKHGRRVGAIVSWGELLLLRKEKPDCERERNAARAQQAVWG